MYFKVSQSYIQAFINLTLLVCVVDGPKALVCDQCGAQFSKEDALESHRQTHTGSVFHFAATLKHLPVYATYLLGDNKRERMLKIVKKKCISSLSKG